MRMREPRDEVMDRYRAARLLRMIELAGVVLGLLAVVAGAALYAVADTWDTNTALVAFILIVSGPTMALWIMTTLGDGQ